MSLRYSFVFCDYFEYSVFPDTDDADCTYLSVSVDWLIVQACSELRGTLCAERQHSRERDSVILSIDTTTSNGDVSIPYVYDFPTTVSADRITSKWSAHLEH